MLIGQMYVEPNVFHSAPFADGVRFRAGKVSFEDGHHLGRPVFDKNKQTVLFVKKITEEDPHTPIRGKCERCDFSVSIAKKNCAC